VTLNGPSWRLDRGRFDDDLRQAAIAACAIYRDNDVKDLQRQGGNWEVHLCDGEIARSRWIVDATGRRATLARRLRVSRIRDKPLIALYAVGGVDAKSESDRTIVEATSEGWWYAARLPSGAPIAGFHTDTRKAGHLRTRPDAWLEELTNALHVNRLVPPETFDKPLRPLDARGMRLANFDGDG
jgi:hypothetical protein